MQFFQKTLFTIALFTISLTNPMELSQSNSTTKNRPSNTYPPQKELPNLPSTQSPMEISQINSMTHNKQSNTYPPQKELPNLPSTQSSMETSQISSMTHNQQSNTYPPQKELPTLPSTQGALKLTPTNNFTQNRPSKAYSTQSRQPKPIQTQSPIISHINPLAIEQKELKPKEVLPIQKQCITNNLIMLLDPTKTETIETQKRMLVQNAIIALYEKTAPIIMSSNIFEVITTIRKKIGDHNLQKLKNCNHQQIASFAKQLLSSHNLREEQFLLIILSLIDFDNKSLICCFHQSEDLILIIPEQYITKNAINASKMSIANKIKTCGFNPTIIAHVEDLSANNLLQQIKRQQSILKNKDQFISNLTSLFISQKKDGLLISLTETSPWLIYLAGHGGNAYRSIGSVRNEFEENKSNLIIFQKALSNNKNDENAKENIALMEANIKKNKKIIHDKKDWPSSQLLVGAANIAGINMDDFSSLMKFFNQTLDVYFLHYTSCFAGGYNQTFVNETLSSLNVNFITSTQGLDERQSTGINLKLQFNSQAPHISAPQKPFSAFFKLLRVFIEQPKEFVKAKKYKKEPFAYVLNALVSNMDYHNQPFIRFPKVGTFGALSLGKKTKNLTNTFIKAHDIENKPIDLSDTDIDIVTIIPSHINIPLNFGKNAHCAIVSPTPAIINTSHAATHIFKEINFENTLQSLIFNFLSFNARIHPQTFIIKKLTGILCQQSSLPCDPHVTNTIHNLIIHIAGIPGPVVRAYGEIFFELNETTYQYPIIIKDFEDPNLKKQIQSIKFTITKDLNPIVCKFLTKNTINSLTTPMTLEFLIKCIDQKVNKQKSSLFNQEGTDNKALNKFLERKPK